MVDDLADRNKGLWCVHTESGAKYLVDLDAKTLTRSAGYDGNDMRWDDEQVPLLRIRQCRVGESAFFYVIGPGFITYRMSTEVQAIERIEPDE